jgi:PilZ domain
VLIAAPELMPALKDRAAMEGGELLAFTDADALRALDVITKRRPAMVALERAFAATPRGAALINRIKADPSLAHLEIRVVSHDSDYARVSGVRVAEAAPSTIAALAEAPLERAWPLDERGTRRGERVPIATGVEALVDGNPAALIDLSATGAQVVSATVLKPNQRVRVTLSDERGTWRISGTIAWAVFEIPPRYRAGIEFLDPPSAAIDAYTLRHRA